MNSHMMEASVGIDDSGDLDMALLDGLSGSLSHSFGLTSREADKMHWSTRKCIADFCRKPARNTVPSKLRYRGRLLEGPVCPAHHQMLRRHFQIDANNPHVKCRNGACAKNCARVLDAMLEGMDAEARVRAASAKKRAARAKSAHSPATTRTGRSVRAARRTAAEASPPSDAEDVDMDAGGAAAGAAPGTGLRRGEGDSGASAPTASPGALVGAAPAAAGRAEAEAAAAAAVATLAPGMNAWGHGDPTAMAMAMAAATSGRDASMQWAIPPGAQALVASRAVQLAQVAAAMTAAGIPPQTIQQTLGPMMAAAGVPASAATAGAAAGAASAAAPAATVDTATAVQPPTASTPRTLHAGIVPPPPPPSGSLGFSSLGMSLDLTTSNIASMFGTAEGQRTASVFPGRASVNPASVPAAGTTGEGGSNAPARGVTTAAVAASAAADDDDDDEDEDEEFNAAVWG